MKICNCTLPFLYGYKICQKCSNYSDDTIFISNDSGYCIDEYGIFKYNYLNEIYKDKHIDIVSESNSRQEI